ncbi:hypothetical protein J6Q66_01770 [bacterium]|nr:hypothetical protein [bacterium]
MDKNTIIELLKQNGIYLLALILLVFYGVNYTINTPVAKFKANQESFKTKKENVDNLQRELDTYKEQIEKKQKEKDSAKKEKEEQEKNRTVKPIFKTKIQSTDSFSSNTPLFEDIIKILKTNKLKLIAIENKTTGFDDPIVQNSGGTYNTCMVDMQILGTYPNFQKFLTYLYNYPYLIKIASINIVPYDVEKTKLIIRLSIILYSETVSETTAISTEN